jgi:hypothetical protein
VSQLDGFAVLHAVGLRGVANIAFVADILGQLVPTGLLAERSTRS